MLSLETARAKSPCWPGSAPLGNKVKNMSQACIGFKCEFCIQAKLDSGSEGSGISELGSLNDDDDKVPGEEADQADPEVAGIERVVPGPKRELAEARQAGDE